MGAPAVLTGREAISLQLLDQDGRLVAQSDRPLSMDAIRRGAIAPYGILLPEEAPPGAYEVALILYEPDQPDTLRLLTTSGADHVPLGTVHVQAR